MLACVELLPYSGGLNRNIVQCLEDFNIPLYLSHTILEIHGENRVTGVTIAQVDNNRKPIPGTESHIECDTVLLSVGLIPENELTRSAGIPIDPRTNGPMVYENRETMIPGIFACGNVLQVHDLVDYVTKESQAAGRAAADYILRPCDQEDSVLELQNGTGISYTVPQRVRLSHISEKAEIFFRVRAPMGNSRIVVTSGDDLIASYKRERMAPGEMEVIRIPKGLLKKAKDSLTVSIQEVSQ